MEGRLGVRGVTRRDVLKFGAAVAADQLARPLGAADALASTAFDQAAFARFVGGLGLKHFSAEEFLVHCSSTGPNTFPPQALWGNLATLAIALDDFRERLGAPVRITSCYRSPAYNATLPGAASRSQHMRFAAADIVGARGGSADWAAIAHAQRQDGVFRGGVGVYRSFLHIDVRGVDRDW